MVNRELFSVELQGFLQLFDGLVVLLLLGKNGAEILAEFCDVGPDFDSAFQVFSGGLEVVLFSRYRAEQDINLIDSGSFLREFFAEALGLLVFFLQDQVADTGLGIVEFDEVFRVVFVGVELEVF